MMRRSGCLLIGVFLLAYVLALAVFNKPLASREEAIEIVKNVTPKPDDYRISQLGGGLYWSLFFMGNPVYKFNVIIVKYEPGIQSREYVITVDAKTKEIVAVTLIKSDE